MRILWLGAYWLGWDLLYRSLKSLNEHEITLIRYDPPRAGDKRIQELIQPYTGQLDVIIYVAVNGGSCMPSIEELKRIRKIAPTVMISPEGSDKSWWCGLIKKYYEDECFDLIVNIDGNPDWPYSEHGITRLTPIDITPWKTPKSWEERKYLCGTWSNRTGLREEVLNTLDDIVVWHGNIPARPEFEEDDNLKSYDLYIDFNRNCKSVLNLAGRGADGSVSLIGLIKNGDGPTLTGLGLAETTLTGAINRCLKDDGTHVKGRVIEAGLAGATLIEQANAETARWFVPGEDYITFATIDEIRQQIHWVESHPDEAQKMANRLHDKVLRDHSPRVFWSDVFNKLFAR